MPQQALCAKPTDGAHAGCFATVLPSSTIRAAFPDAVYGLTPNDLSTLYDYPAPYNQGWMGAGQTVAVVVAGDYAQAEADLGVYRKFFNLPPCTSANGCLTKVGAAATGQSSQTGIASSISAFATNANAAGWAAETDSDIEVVSAVCPHCKIMIAEAASSSIADLTNAVWAAANAQASIINASFGSPEVSGDRQYWDAYSNPQIKVVAASGDWGFGVYFPASHSDVIAVGGTSLAVNGTNVTETAWSGSGSGCSSMFRSMGWQHPATVSGWCTNRNVADVAAVADPSTGVAIYDSSLPGGGGWSTFGGTSVAAPIITSMYALSGDTANGLGAQHLYGAPAGAFINVTGGSNGICTPLYLCTATSGYNGPTGIGIPNGLSGF